MGPADDTNRYVAFLRGIAPTNPSMRNEKLRGVFQNLGFDNVASVLTSGNIVFSTTQNDVPALEQRIQQALVEELGIPGSTIIRRHIELQALVDADPFPGLTHSSSTYLVVTFVKDGSPGPPPRPPRRVESAVRVVGYNEQVRAILAVIDNTASAAPQYMGWMEQVYGTEITTRTWLTIQRILKKLE